MGIPTKPTMGIKSTEFNKQIAMFQHGMCWLGNGAFASQEDIPEASLVGISQFIAFLEASFDVVSDLAEKPGKESSKVVKLKTNSYMVEGKRTNTIELYLVGLTQERKDWLESELNKDIKTIVLLSNDYTNVLVFNGMSWIYERETEIDGLFTSTISTGYSGATKNRYFIIKGLEYYGYGNIPWGDYWNGICELPEVII